MNLFRSEEHVKRWPLHFQAADEYVMSVADWAEVFSASMFRNRLDPDYFERSQQYLEDYHQALRIKGKAVPSPDRVLLTVMFTDIVDSTRQAVALGDETWRALLTRHDEIIRSQLQHFGGTEVKHTGDGFLSSFASPARAIRAAAAIRDAAADIGLQVRIGIHAGECELRGSDLSGVGVHIGSRVMAAANPGEILATQTVVTAVTGSGIDFVDRGVHEFKGVPGTWTLHSAAV
jgi:class 3 adenylate cyclase